MPARLVAAARLPAAGAVSVAIMTTVWRMDLPCTDKMVLLALADAANDDGVTWIAVASRRRGDRLDLTRKTSLSERAVQGAIRRLCEAGHLCRDEKPGRGVIYTVAPAPAAPRMDRAPAGDRLDPRSPCGESVSNRHLPSESPSAGRASKRCPADWSPGAADLELAGALGLAPAEVACELGKFRDHTFQTVRTDWSATFCNWIRRTAENSRHVRPDAPSARLAAKRANHDRALAGLASIARARGLDG